MDFLPVPKEICPKSYEPECSEIVLIALMNTISFTFLLAFSPSYFTIEIVRPLLREKTKLHLTRNDLKTIAPSHPLMSKVLEKVILSLNFIEIFIIFSVIFVSQFITSSTVMKLTTLCWKDLSSHTYIELAAHAQSFQHVLGIHGTALSRVKKYLSKKKHCVRK